MVGLHPMLVFDAKHTCAEVSEGWWSWGREFGANWCGLLHIPVYILWGILKTVLCVDVLIKDSAEQVVCRVFRQRPEHDIGQSALFLNLIHSKPYLGSGSSKGLGNELRIGRWPWLHQVAIVWPLSKDFKSICSRGTTSWLIPRYDPSHAGIGK